MRKYFQNCKVLIRQMALLFLSLLLLLFFCSNSSITVTIISVLTTSSAPKCDNVITCSWFLGWKSFFLLLAALLRALIHISWHRMVLQLL